MSRTLDDDDIFQTGGYDASYTGMLEEENADLNACILGMQCLLAWDRAVHMWEGMVSSSTNDRKKYAEFVKWYDYWRRKFIDLSGIPDAPVAGTARESIAYWCRVNP